MAVNVSRTIHSEHQVQGYPPVATRNHVVHDADGVADEREITGDLAESNVRGQRVVWAENITFLAKERGIKLMDLAKEVDVTVSFFSRARKGDSRADAVVLSNIADRLGVSLDLLMKVDLSAMGESEQLVVKSLNKMIQETVSEKIRWEGFDQYETKSLGRNSQPKFPFMVISEVDPEERIFIEYRQPFCVDGDTAEVSGKFFRAKMSDCIDLYILPVQVVMKREEEHGYSTDSLSGIDIFFRMASGEIKPMCCTYKGVRPEIVQKMSELYEVVRKKVEQAMLDPFTSELLTDYLNNRLDERDDPPF